MSLEELAGESDQSQVKFYLFSSPEGDIFRWENGKKPNENPRRFRRGSTKMHDI